MSASQMRLMAPGDWLLDLDVLGELKPDVLEKGLASLGFRDAVFDKAEGRFSIAVRVPETGNVLRDTDLLTWKIHRFEGDAFAAPRGEKAFFKLIRGQRYELRFLVRRYASSTLQAVREALLAYGFTEISFLVRTVRNTRLPRSPNDALDVACAVATWGAGNSATTAADPLLFEHVRETS